MKTLIQRISDIGLFVVMFLITAVGCAQPAPANRPDLYTKTLDDKLTKMLRFDVPLIGAEELKDLEEVTIFDTRDLQEYEVSHIPGANFLSPNQSFDGWNGVSDKNETIVVYCSVGYRSEIVARKLIKQGYTNVYNLYGSLFDWVDKGFPIEDASGKSTRSVHTYNKRWSKLVTGSNVDKTW